MHNRHYVSLVIKLHIANPIFFSKGFPAIFKISDIMAMPYDAQRIGFIKPNQYLSAITQFRYHACAGFSIGSLTTVFGLPVLVIFLFYLIEHLLDRCGPIVPESKAHTYL